ncbi:hypothetical protein MTBBW1_3360001 [Desulfamplus magnetovallimortis]|uniref:Uncharacterized protein n=1 Tax=Desulfamplus magnetovallimortis TaxID=1246637 RepID=A0A1W1HGC7_9BACT|nr:hypothetical protein MTBBW1_3360001 [Desulfamplus magnetovallimortis]
MLERLQRARSQSPLIGAVFLTYARRYGLSAICAWSQSPLIGAVFLTFFDVMIGSSCAESLNPPLIGGSVSDSTCS